MLQCQQEAWKRDSFPHKLLCKKIKSLRESFGDDWSQLWPPDFTYTQFDALCKAKGVDEQLVEAVADTIAALRMQQRMFREDTERANASQISRLVLAAQQKASQQQKERIEAELGHNVTIITREASVSLLHPHAYRQ
jgi:hypothetical protein